MREQWRRTRRSQNGCQTDQDSDELQAERKTRKSGRTRQPKDQKKIKNQQNFIENLIAEEYREKELIESD